MDEKNVTWQRKYMKLNFSWDNLPRKVLRWYEDVCRLFHIYYAKEKFFAHNAQVPDSGMWIAVQWSVNFLLAP